MTIKTVIELSDAQARFAERLVAEGRYPSIDSVLSAGLDAMMSEDSQQDDPLAGAAEEIRRRMELAPDGFGDWDGQALMERIAQRAKQRRA